ncbi:MAG: hypothetical protein M0024_10470 [Nitrospiraceae bacterium]|nr:hypothetical protein [Nitrospiraceae bacterium]
MLDEYLSATPEERLIAALLHCHDPFLGEVVEKNEAEEEMAVRGNCKNCGKQIYETYYNGEIEDLLAGRTECPACRKGCIKFNMHIHLANRPATTEVLGKCCSCGNTELDDED